MSATTSHPKLTSRFEEALVYAARAHWRQIRKVTPRTGAADEAADDARAEIPYVAHLLAVASLVLENGGGEDEAIAALLHDAIEDAGGLARRDDIRARFGDDVVRIVEACSDSDGESKAPWRERKERYLAHLAATSDARVRLVSACDKLHNARAVLADYAKSGETLWERFNGQRNGTLWYYRSLADEIARGGPAAIADEIGRAVSELEELVRAADPDWQPEPPFRP
ncbi:HD domain-containing protein [Candidatus Binatia bacterium]|nr:HD domain-containing protein [Candidatus Binatia bacterium]